MSTTSLFSRIDTLREELNATPLTAEQREKLDKKMRLEFHYNTNHIEGNTLTYGETVLLFLHDEIRGAHTSREIDEMKASEVALRMVEDLAADTEHPLTETFIKELNRVLLKEPFWKEAITADGQETRRLIDIGEYKKFPNNVRTQTGEIFHYSSPQDTPIQMGELIDWYRRELEEKGLHPVALAAALHYRFVRIHPFDDGNGRLSRLLMNYVLLRAGYPPVVIKSADKKGYLNALHDADAGILESFVGYIAKEEEWSLEIALKAARGESLEEMDDWRKELVLLKRELGKPDGKGVAKSAMVIQELVNKMIVPFLEMLVIGLSEYNELFKETNDSYFNHEIEEYSNDWFSEENSTEFAERDTELLFYDSFIYRLNLKNFKNNGDRFSLHLFLNWKFNLYDYTFTFETVNGSEQTITHFYHQDLTESEKAEVIAESGKWILQEIKRHLQ